MPTAGQGTANWWVNDQTPENPYDKSEDYESFLDYLGALNRSLTPKIASEPLVINVSGLNDHPEFKEAAIGALTMWSTVTPLQFEIVDDRPFDRRTQWMEVVSPEIGEEDDGSAYSSNRYVSIGQRFHDTEPDRTDFGGYVFNSFLHEFGHEFGLNHPGLYNYGGPGGVQINYLNNATWVYDRQQYSIMSYFDGIDVGETTRWTATTPMIADIEAVLRRFFSTVNSDGERVYQRVELNTGDDVYGFGSTKFGYELTASGMQHDVGFVIHDTGGNDTIDFSGSTAGTILDLRIGQFSSVNGHHNNVAIFQGHNANWREYLIENGIGSDHADVIIGNRGNNVLDGRGGADSMAGNGGDDIYMVDSAGDVVRERADGGNDTILVMTAGLVIGDFANVENVIYVGATPTTETGTGADPLPSVLGEIVMGTVAADSLNGGGGSQTIFGLAGDDVIVGGRDSLASRDINNTIAIEDLEDQTESDDGNDALYGGAGNDTIMGGAGDDILDGGDGDDVLRGQDGVDVFRGGAGSDTVDFSMESPFQLLVNLAANIASGGTASGDTFYDIENLIGSDDRIDRFIGTAAANHFWGRGGGDYFNGGAGDDTLDGDRDGDILYGEDGNDLIIGGSGQDYLNGGNGVDTVDYTGSGSGVTIDLAAGSARGGDGDGPVQIVGRGMVIRHDILAGFENAVGSFYADHLIGDGGANSLSGGSGDDTLTGGIGADTLVGGAGSDTADYASATAGVVLDLLRTTNAGDTYLSIENLAGSGHGDRLLGGNAANVLTGQGGNDTLYGRGGDDVLLGDFPYRGDPLPTPGMGTGYATLGPDATNNSMATAFDISNNFSLAADPDIFDSTTTLHTTVNATGNGQGGYYRIDLAAGTVLTVDIDHIADPDVHDSWLLIMDDQGNIVADNDDGGGDPGSTSGRDSSVVFIVRETGTYYLLEGSWSETAPGNGFADSVPEGSTYELNVSVEFPPAPVDPGVAGADVLYGGAGADLLDGGLGADTLVGGLGQDSFRFSTDPGAGNVDVLSDFSTADDQILLDSRVFGAVGGTLTFGEFRATPAGTAQDADDRIIYDSDDGGLWYDADGSGSGAAVRFAQLTAGLNLSVADFHVV